MFYIVSTCFSIYHVSIISAIFSHKVSELNSKTDFVFASVSDFTSRIGNLSNGRAYTCYCTSDFTNLITSGGSAGTARGFFSKNSNGTTDFLVIVMGNSNIMYSARLNNTGEGVTYNKTFSDDATLLRRTINASDILVNIISDISEMDDINETCIRYVQGALLEGKSIYGFVLTAKAGAVLSQIIFGSFTGVSGIAVRGKSSSPIQWKDWKIL